MYLSVHPSVRQSILLSVVPYARHSVHPSFCLSVLPCIRPPISPSVQPSVRPFAVHHPCVRPSFCPPVLLSVLLSVHPSVCLSVRPSVRPSVSPSEFRPSVRTSVLRPSVRRPFRPSHCQTVRHPQALFSKLKIRHSNISVLVAWFVGQGRYEVLSMQKLEFVVWTHQIRSVKVRDCEFMVCECDWG